jgi:hypothetical protein
MGDEMTTSKRPFRAIDEAAIRFVIMMREVEDPNPRGPWQWAPHVASRPLTREALLAALADFTDECDNEWKGEAESILAARGHHFRHFWLEEACPCGDHS